MECSFPLRMLTKDAFWAKHARVPSLWRSIFPGKGSFIGAKVMFSSFCWKSELMLCPVTIITITDHHDQPWRCLSVDHYKAQAHPPKVEANPPLWTDTTSLMRPFHFKIYITHYIQHQLTTSLYNIHRVMQLLHLNRFINSSFTEWSSAAPQPSSSQSFSWLCSSSSSMSPITASLLFSSSYCRPSLSSSTSSSSSFSCW